MRIILFDALFAAGAEFNIGMVGMRAMESLRLEKSYRMWGSDLTPDYTPYRGRARPLRAPGQGPVHRQGGAGEAAQGGGAASFRHLRSTRRHGRRSLGNEPLFDAKGNIIGRATAGYYGHALGKSLGLGYIKPEFAAVGSGIEIEILGERKRATILVDSPYDPENKDLRA
jgi:dimethylglycine dehydrogenase